MILFIFVVLFPSLLIVKTFTDGNFTTFPEFDLGEGITGLPRDFGCGGYRYLGPDDSYTNCSELCDSNDYTYKFITDKQNFIVNGKKLVGSYCIKNGYSKCNLNTSQVVVSKTGYACISKFPQILGGESGNQIIVCNGKLYDRLTDETYVNFIPNNLFFTSVDETLIDGQFRFECDNADDTIPVPPSLGTRLERDKNLCNSLDAAGIYDETTFTCKCTEYLPNGICSKAREGFGVATEIAGSRYAYTVSRDCIDIFDPEFNELQKTLFPCGPKNLKVENALINITNTYHPATLAKLLG